MSLKVNGVDLISSSTASLNLPLGTTLERPATPINGMIRYNTEKNKVEVYANGNWRSLNSTIMPNQSSIGPGASTIYSWGLNNYGESLLPPTTSLYVVPSLSIETFNFKKIVTSIEGDSTFVIRADNTLWAVGNNSHGQLGLGDTVDRSSLTQVGNSKWNDISCYSTHTAGVRTDGTLWTWGKNDLGQLAQGDLVNYSSPNQVGTLAVWSTVACGNSHTVAIKTDGKLWVSGDNTNGQLGIGSTTSTQIMIQSTTTVTTAWGKVYCGKNSSYAVNNDGYIYSWGDNTSGQLGLNTTTAFYTVPTKITTLTNMSAGSISVGKSHVLAVTPNNYLYTWGSNTSGQLGFGNTTNITQPMRYGTGTNWWLCSAGNDFSLAVTSDGTMYGCGLNNNAQLGLDDTFNRTVFEQLNSIFWGSVFAGNNQAIASKSVASTDYGGILFTTNTVWTVPAGVTSICIAAIGGGGSGARLTGGGGGGAAYANNVIVTTGQKIQIVVGGGSFGTYAQNYGFSGGDSTVSIDTTGAGAYVNILTANGGGGGTDYNTKSVAPGGLFSINTQQVSGTSGGFSGGYGGYYYSTTSATNGGPGIGLGYVGSGGGGGAYYAGSGYNYANGGIGWKNHAGGTGVAAGGGGGGGFLGANAAGGAGSSTTTNAGAAGGALGGGGGGGVGNNTSGSGSSGGVRIIWGAGRSFPSFQTDKLGSEV